MNKYTLHEKFIIGLKDKYDMVPSDLNGWWYIGGEERDTDDDGDAVTTTTYFDLVKKDNPELIASLEPLPRSNECVCCHEIKYNHWITDGTKVLVIGSCCKKQFAELYGVACGRNCDNCHDPHRNRKVNRCNDCRKIICDNCNLPRDPNDKLCQSLVCRRKRYKRSSIFESPQPPQQVSVVIPQEPQKVSVEIIPKKRPKCVYCEYYLADRDPAHFPYCKDCYIYKHRFEIYGRK